MSKSTTKIKGYLYHSAEPKQGMGKVTWDKAGWEQYLANYKDVKIEKCEVDDTTDYLISARGTKGADWKQRELIAEAYTTHPVKG